MQKTPKMDFVVSPQYFDVARKKNEAEKEMTRTEKPKENGEGKIIFRTLT